MRRGHLAVLLIIAVPATPAAADTLLWTECNNFGPGGDIQRANLDGSGQATVIPRLDGPTGIAFNPADGMMYWAQGDDNTDTGTIHRANLNGTGIQQIVSGQLFTTGLAVDPVGGHVFWRTHSSANDPFGDDIRRANLDGSNRQTVVHSPSMEGNGNLALDLANGAIYYADYLDGLIRRANLDGTGQPTTLISGLAGPVGVALDVPHGKLYWADFGANAIYQANLDGSDQLFLISASAPSGLALDLAAGKIYWTDASGNV